MQINSSSSSQSMANQHFKAGYIYKVSDDLKEMITKNDSYKRLILENDVFITGSARGIKWSDPFRLRTPQADEKGSVICVVNSKKSGQNLAKYVSAVDGNLYAPMKQHVGKVLNFLENFETKNRVTRFVDYDL